MAQPRLEDDLQFLWNEVKKGFSFLTEYFKEKYDDHKLEQNIESWKEGPFPKIKRYFVWVLVLVSFVIFALWRNVESLIFLGFLAIIFYELVFQKSWITPFIGELLTLFYGWAKDLIIWVYETLLSEIPKLFWWLVGIATDLLLFAWEIVLDILKMAYDAVKEVAGGLIGFAKEVVMGIFSLIGEIFTEIFSLFFGSSKQGS